MKQKAASKVFIIAEAGSNWRMGTAKRDMEMAKRLIDVAVEAGADAVKFQTYRPETVYVENAGESSYLAQAGILESIRAIFTDLAMPYEMIPQLHEYCQAQRIEFMSSSFSPADFAAVDPYVKRHKLASYEITHLRLLELAGRSGKPLILSTGAAVEEEIQWAVDTFRQNGGTELTLLQCTCQYPAEPASANLRVLPWLKERFGVTVGLSDHTRHPLYGPLAAVALGARVIEKHHTLDNRLPGPDHAFAITAHELKELVVGVREVEKMLGNGQKSVSSTEQELHQFAQRGIQALHTIESGTPFSEGHNVAILRPGKQPKGIHSKYIVQLEGKRATRRILAGTGIQLGDWE